MPGIDWNGVARQCGYTDAAEMWNALYVLKKESIEAIALRFNVGKNTVRDQLEKCGVQIKKRGGPNYQKIQMNDELLIRMANEGTQSVADSMGVSYTTLHKAKKAFERAKNPPTPETSAEPSSESEQESPEPPPAREG